MAEKGDGGDAKWPGVAVTDKDACCDVFLKIPNLQAKKKMGLGAYESKNSQIKVFFEPESVDATISVTDKAGKVSDYAYKKKLPEDIDIAKSKWLIFKEERIKLELKKVKPGSWERHAKYLQTKD